MKPENHGKSWDTYSCMQLAALIKDGIPFGQIARVMGRTLAAVITQAERSGYVHVVDNPITRTKSIYILKHRENIAWETFNDK